MGTNNLLWGLGLLLFGIYAIWDVRKHPTEEADIWQYDTKRYIAGVGGIIGGILALLAYFSGKHWHSILTFWGEIRKS